MRSYLFSQLTLHKGEPDSGRPHLFLVPSGSQQVPSLPLPWRGIDEHFLTAPCLFSLILSSSSFPLAKFSSRPPPPVQFLHSLALPVNIFPACIIASSHSRPEEVGLLKLDLKARIILPCLPLQIQKYKRRAMGSPLPLFFSLFKTNTIWNFYSSFYSQIRMEADGFTLSLILPPFPSAWFYSYVGVFVVVLICKS